MKRIVALILSLVFVFALLGQVMPVFAENANYKPGTYSGEARGMYGEVMVQVTVDEMKIISIDAKAPKDTRRLANAAITKVTDEIVKKQSLVVDTATGATITSYGVISAVKNALQKVVVNTEVLTQKAEKAEDLELPDESFDVVIVGGGGSGLAAAVQIGKDSDLSVLVLEKAAYTGGSTALSGGLILVGGTQYNGKDGALDFTPEEFLEYFKKRTAEMSRRPEDMWINEDLVLRIGQMAAPTFQYYMDEGAEISFLYNSEQWSDTKGLAGFIHAGKVGAEGASYLWGDWFTNLAEKNGAEVRVNSKVTALISDGGIVNGVVVEGPDGQYTVKAKKVILACGGYGNNIPMLTNLHPDVPNIETTVSYTVPTDTGDFFELVEGLDAARAGYGHINVLGAGPGRGYHTEEGMLALIGFNVWVNKDGKRFANEKEYPPYHVSFEIFKQPDGLVYGIAGSDLVFTDSNTGRTGVDVLKDAADAGIAYKGETLKELAEKIGVNAKELEKTIDDYNIDTATKDTPAPIAQAPYYALRIYPTVLGTIGGLKANENCQILNTKDKPIPNLYGAGEVIFGNVYLEEYYASGSGVTVAIYTGTIAGQEVVKSLKD